MHVYLRVMKGAGGASGPGRARVRGAQQAPPRPPPNIPLPAQLVRERRGTRRSPRGAAGARVRGSRACFERDSSRVCVEREGGTGCVPLDADTSLSTQTRPSRHRHVPLDADTSLSTQTRSSRHRHVPLDADMSLSTQTRPSRRRQACEGSLRREDTQGRGMAPTPVAQAAALIPTNSAFPTPSESGSDRRRREAPSRLRLPCESGSCGGTLASGQLSSGMTAAGGGADTVLGPGPACGNILCRPAASTAQPETAMIGHCAGQ